MRVSWSSVRLCIVYNSIRAEDLQYVFQGSHVTWLLHWLGTWKWTKCGNGEQQNEVFGGQMKQLPDWMCLLSSICRKHWITTGRCLWTRRHSYRWRVTEPNRFPAGATTSKKITSSNRKSWSAPADNYEQPCNTVLTIWMRGGAPQEKEHHASLDNEK